ncbi:Inner membrane protein YcdZ [Enterobacter cloacae]|nr:Inner membrane protein YcdZ [Enterobacter cloacae]
MRTMNILLCIAITTGILSGLWGWVAVSLGLLSWAGFLGCTAYFACPQGGLKGLFISGCTLLSGVVWALVIMKGSALAPHLEILGYAMTGIVAFLMCVQAKHLLLSFVPGTFMGACRAGGLEAGGPFAHAGVTVWLRHEEQRPLACGPTREEPERSCGK